MQRRNLRNIVAAGSLWVLFVLYTTALKYIDVKPIGPEGSSVGFAAINQTVNRMFGLNMLLYSITDWLGVVSIFVAVGFAVIGLVELVKTKSILGVDSSILVLGAFYMLVMSAYLFFEWNIVNFRPVLIANTLEASYPSSTTLLVMCVMPTAMIQFHRFIQSKTVRILLNSIFGVFVVFVVIGRLLSGVHWFTDIIGSILLSAALVMLYYTVNQLIRAKQPK